MGNASVSPRKQKQKIPPDVDNPPFYLPLKPFNGRYRVVSNLGNGSFGSVGLAKSSQDLLDSSKFRIYRNTLLDRNEFYKHENYFNKKTGLVAIKTMTKKLNALNDYSKVKEIRFILAIPYHPNLVQVFELFIDNVSFKLHIVMECLDQNLYQLMKARKNNFFSQTTLKSILSQILNGIRHIHRNQYFHRDIKPENILVSPSNRFYDQEFINSKNFKYHDCFIVKIADYGLARHVDNKRPYTSYVSTRWYRAPEILLRKNWYSRPVDIWAFGSVAAEIATFRPLFPGSDEIEQTWKVLDVLGTPISNNNIGNYFPCYGYWDEAAVLCSQLGLKLPVKECIDITHLIPNRDLTPLCDVIKACLAWNPNTRADVEAICAMPYFKGTCVDDSPTMPIPVPAYTKAPIGKKYANYDKSNGSFDFSRSEMLAGIPSLKKEEFINVATNENNGSISPNATEVNYSFSNDVQQSPSESKLFLNDFELQLPPKVLKPEESAPNLTQESIVTNDENYNGFSQNLNNYNYISETQFNLNNAKPRTPNLKSVSNMSVFNFNGSNSSNYYNDVSPNIDPNFISYQPQQAHHTYNIVGEHGSVNMRSDSLDDFDDWNKPIAGVHNMGNGSNYNGNSSLNGQIDHFDDKFRYDGSNNDSLLGLYTTYQEQNDITNHSISSNIPNFTGELLSKFNLRRISLNDSNHYTNSHDQTGSFHSYKQ